MYNDNKQSCLILVAEPRQAALALNVLSQTGLMMLHRLGRLLQALFQTWVAMPGAIKHHVKLTHQHTPGTQKVVVTGPPGRNVTAEFASMQLLQE